MAEYFIVAGYSFKSAMNNTAIYAKIQSGMLRSIDDPSYLMQIMHGFNGQGANLHDRSYATTHGDVNHA
jgi:hypothetical protein